MNLSLPRPFPRTADHAEIVRQDVLPDVPAARGTTDRRITDAPAIAYTSKNIDVDLTSCGVCIIFTMFISSVYINIVMVKSTPT